MGSYPTLPLKREDGDTETPPVRHTSQSGSSGAIGGLKLPSWSDNTNGVSLKYWLCHAIYTMVYLHAVLMLHISYTYFAT